jgi:hypothetical protein
MNIRRYGALLFLVVTGNAMGSTFAITEDELDPAIFPAVADSLRANLDGPNAPSGLSEARKADVRRSLDELEDLLLRDDGRSNSERVRGLQDRINTHLLPQVAKNDGKSEVVCRRVKKVGSNIPTTECRTRAEMDRDEHLADEQMQRWQQGVNTN